jgi:DNA-binding IclR family transcriptional regulator
MSAETSQTLDRGLRLLELLADPARHAAPSVSDLAAGLEISRPAVYRLLATLEAHGLVDRTRDGQVRLGLGLLPLARAVTPRLYDAALPVLRQLAEDVGATAHLTVVEPGPPDRLGSPGEAVAVAVVEPSHTAMHVAYRVGVRHRLDQGAAGRAIILARAGRRDRQYVVTEGELQPGAVGIAAPVLGVAGLEASVGLVALGRAGRPGSLDPALAGPRVVAAAAAIAAALT